MIMVNSVAEAGVDGMPAEATILNADGRILTVNDAWRRFADENHGTDPGYWVGENYFEVCRDADDDSRATEVLDGLQAVLAGERDRFQLGYPCHSPAEQRWYALDAGGFSFDGDDFLFVCHFDITDRKLAEREAAARTKQLEAVIGALAHDTRNPLQIIDGYAEQIADDIGDAEELDRIRRAAARIDEIAEATLTFGQSGKLSSAEPLSLKTIANDAWAHVSTGDATLSIADPPTIHGDRRLLHQLFENLFENAVEYASPDCAVTVGSVDDGFYVADNGPGIPAAIREKTLREDFSTHGTGGMGLPIVQAVVEAHGGTLKITDTADGGARFEITGIDIAPETISPSREDTVSTPEGFSLKY